MSFTNIPQLERISTTPPPTPVPSTNICVGLRSLTYLLIIIAKSIRDKSLNVIGSSSSKPFLKQSTERSAPNLATSTPKTSGTFPKKFLSMDLWLACCTSNNEIRLLLALAVKSHNISRLKVSSDTDFLYCSISALSRASV